MQSVNYGILELDSLANEQKCGFQDLTETGWAVSEIRQEIRQLSIMNA